MAARFRDKKGRFMKTTLRDESGHITSYSTKEPSAARLQEVLRQAERNGAKGVGIVANVGQFQNYEATEASPRIVRAYRRKEEAAAPGALRSRLYGKDQKGQLLAEIRAATGAEVVKDLHSVTFNFIY